MASVMAKGSEANGECVEAIRIEVGRNILRMVLACLAVLRSYDKAKNAVSDLPLG